MGEPMTPATKETATAYRSLSGRRFFTLRGALRSSARVLVRKRCQCENPEFDAGGMTYPGFECEYCKTAEDGSSKGSMVVERLVRRWMRNFAAQREARP